MERSNVDRVPPVPEQRPRLVRILHEDPDLARRLDADEARAAARQTVGILEEISPGPWKPATLAQGKCVFGGLVLDGLLVRELTVGGAVTAELLGAGDLVLPQDADEPVPFVGAQMTWTVLDATRVAWLDGPFVVAVRRWPELAAVLLERSQRRLVRVGVLQAIAQLTRIDDRVLATFRQSDIIPVIAPIGVGAGGETYNINADTVAGAVAAAVKAKRFLLLTDVAGVLDDEKRLIPELTAAEARRLIVEGTVSGGMIPKVETCLGAVDGGVEAAVILDGRVPHAILLELFTEGAGTLIRRG